MLFFELLSNYLCLPNGFYKYLDHDLDFCIYNVVSISTFIKPYLLWLLLSLGKNFFLESAMRSFCISYRFGSEGNLYKSLTISRNANRHDSNGIMQMEWQWQCKRQWHVFHHAKREKSLSNLGRQF